MEYRQSKGKCTESMKKKLKVLCILISVIFLCAAYVIHCQEHLTVTNYEVTAPVNEPIRIVQLTDLHNHEFGNRNSRLISSVKELSPDLIFMTGDMLNEDDPDSSVICKLISDLKDVAPVYFSMGNHEYHWGTSKETRKLFTDAGAIVVDLSYLDVTVKSSNLRIGGYYGSYRVPHLKGLSAEETEKEMAFFDEFENTDRYKILLSHVPTAWVDWNYIDKYPVDLIFSGHYHGGVIRIPFVGGLYAPYVGWFPKNTKGVFFGKYGTCILSTGLAGKKMFPRINNDPEIVITDLVPD